MDQLVEIKCFICGDPICTTVDMGFRTAKCVKCQRGDKIIEEAQPLETEHLKTYGEELFDIINEVTGSIASSVSDGIRKAKEARKKKTDSKIKLKKGM